MVVYSDVPVKNSASVVHPAHPPLEDTGVLADGAKQYKAGTILKMDANGKLLAAAPADDPIAVLTKDSDGKNAEVLVLWHGAVVSGRLLNSSGANPVAASDAMIPKLRTAGIYPIQSFDYSKKGVV
jgi:hypothetical protein